MSTADENSDDIMVNYLGQGYFHQDFRYEAASPEALVERFAAEDWTEYIKILIDEL